MKKIAEKIKSIFKKKETCGEKKEEMPAPQPAVSRKKSKQELETPENKAIIDAIKKVMDPELGVDLWTMGLIYDIAQEKGNVHILMTFTSFVCPLGPQMIESLKQEIRKVKGVKTVGVEVTFEPFWEPEPGLREMLGV
jgi:metal-sulfur cluster biosynthetic enzyme